MDGNARASRSITTPIGELMLVAEGDALVEIRMGPRHEEARYVKPHEGDDVLETAQRQLEAYFAGESLSFSFPMRLRGTAFQRAVWNTAREIDYGDTSTYGMLAARIGRPRAARAVGQALAANPLPVVVPCHRVVGHRGDLTGFGGGIDRKRQLLELEKTSRCLMPAAATPGTRP